MVKTSGVHLDEKPKYYQGLTVHGRKRQDWAAKSAARGTGRGRRISTEVEYSLVLRSIFRGNLQSAEFFLSDAPLRRYLEFAKRLKGDKRVESLAQTKGGIEGALSKWLETRSELALHIAIMTAPEGDGTTPMFDYLMRTMPGLIEVKDEDGNTALLTALKLRRIGAAQVLIKAGANQVVRDGQGKNALHVILGDQSYTKSTKVLRRTLDLLDSKLISGMLMEKSTDGQGNTSTPLALLLGNYLNAHTFEACEIVFEFSGGRDLEILNGAGDYVLHTLVRDSREMMVKQLVDYRPEMLHWENATGMTPMDVAETRYLREVIESPPKLENRRKGASSIVNRNDSEFLSKEIKAKRHPGLAELDAFIAGDDGEGLEERSTSWRMNRLLQRLAVKYKGKRKLVSVLDANEVAKRLALQQQKRNEETRRQERLGLNATGMSYRERYPPRDNSAEKTIHDEVYQWWGTASSSKKADWERWEAEVLDEEFVDAEE
jgi:hypothetical protein